MTDTWSRNRSALGEFLNVILGNLNVISKNRVEIFESLVEKMKSLVEKFDNPEGKLKRETLRKETLPQVVAVGG